MPALVEVGNDKSVTKSRLAALLPAWSAADETVLDQLLSATGREVTLYRIGPGGSCILTTSRLLSQENYPAEAID